MAARIEAQREQEDDRPMTGSTQPQQQQQDEGGRKEVSLTAFRVMFPGVVSSSEA